MDVSKGVIGIWNSQPRDKSPYKKVSGSQATESGQKNVRLYLVRPRVVIVRLDLGIKLQV